MGRIAAIVFAHGHHNKESASIVAQHAVDDLLPKIRKIITERSRTGRQLDGNDIDDIMDAIEEVL